MKPFLITTGSIFALIAVAHIARIVDEWPPSFNSETILVQSLTLLAIAMSAWAFLLLRKIKS